MNQEMTEESGCGPWSEDAGERSSGTQHPTLLHTDIPEDIEAKLYDMDGKDNEAATPCTQVVEGVMEVRRQGAGMSRIRSAINKALVRFPDILNSKEHSICNSPSSSKKCCDDVTSPCLEANIHEDNPTIRDSEASSESTNGAEFASSSLQKVLVVEEMEELCTAQPPMTTYLGDPSGDHMTISRQSSSAFTTATSNPQSTAVSTHSSHSNLLSLTASSYDAINYLPHGHYTDTHPSLSSRRRLGRHGFPVSASFHGMASTKFGTDYQALPRYASDPYILGSSTESPPTYNYAHTSLGLPHHSRLPNDPVRPYVSIRQDSGTDWSSSNWPSTDSSSPHFSDFSTDITVVVVSPRSIFGDPNVPSSLGETPVSGDVGNEAMSPRGYGYLQKYPNDAIDDTFSTPYSGVSDGYYSPSRSVNTRDSVVHSPAGDMTDASGSSNAHAIHRTNGNASPKRDYFIAHEKVSSSYIAGRAGSDESSGRDSNIVQSPNKQGSPVTTKKAVPSTMAVKTLQRHQQTTSKRKTNRDTGAMVSFPTRSGHLAPSDPPDGTVYARSHSMRHFHSHGRLHPEDHSFMRSNTLPTIHVHNALREAHGNITTRPGMSRLELQNHGSRMLRTPSVPQFSPSPSPVALQSGLHSLGDELKRFKHRGNLASAGPLKDINGRSQRQSLLEKARINQHRIALLKSKDLPSYLPSSKVQLKPHKIKASQRTAQKSVPSSSYSSPQLASTRTWGDFSNTSKSFSKSPHRTHSGFAERFRQQISSPLDGSSANSTEHTDTFDPSNVPTDASLSPRAAQACGVHADQSRTSSNTPRRASTSVYKTYSNPTMSNKLDSSTSGGNVKESVLSRAISDAEVVNTSVVTNGDVSDTSTVYSALLLSSSFSSSPPISPSVSVSPPCTSPPSVVSDDAFSPIRRITDSATLMDELVTISPASTPVPPQSADSRVSPSIADGPANVVSIDVHNNEGYEAYIPSVASATEVSTPQSNTRDASHSSITVPTADPSSLPSPVRASSPTREDVCRTLFTPDSTRSSISSQYKVNSTHSGSSVSDRDSTWSLSTSSSASARTPLVSSSPVSPVHPPTTHSSSNTPSPHAKSDRSNSSSGSNSILGHKLLADSNPVSPVHTPDTHTNSSDTSRQGHELDSLSVTPEEATSVNEGGVITTDDEEVTERPVLKNIAMLSSADPREPEGGIAFGDMGGKVAHGGHDSIVPSDELSLEEPANSNTQVGYVVTSGAAQVPRSGPWTPVSIGGTGASDSETITTLSSTSTAVNEANALIGTSLSPPHGWRRQRQDSLIAALFDPSINISSKAFMDPAHFGVSVNRALENSALDGMSYDSYRPYSILHSTTTSPVAPHDQISNSSKHDNMGDNDDGYRVMSSLDSLPDHIMSPVSSRAPRSPDVPLSPDSGENLAQLRPHVVTSPIGYRGNGNFDSQTALYTNSSTSEPLSNGHPSVLSSWTSTPLASSDSWTSFVETISAPIRSPVSLSDMANDHTDRFIPDSDVENTTNSNDAPDDSEQHGNRSDHFGKSSPNSKLSQNLQTTISTSDAKDSPIWILTPSSEAGVLVAPYPSSGSVSSYHSKPRSPTTLGEVILPAIPSQSTRSPGTRRMSDGAKLSTLVYVHALSSSSDTFEKKPPAQTVLDLVDAINHPKTLDTPSTSSKNTLPLLRERRRSVFHRSLAVPSSWEDTNRESSIVLDEGNAMATPPPRPKSRDEDGHGNVLTHSE